MVLLEGKPLKFLCQGLYEKIHKGFILKSLKLSVYPFLSFCTQLLICFVFKSSNIYRHINIRLLKHIVIFDNELGFIWLFGYFKGIT